MENDDGISSQNPSLLDDEVESLSSSKGSEENLKIQQAENARAEKAEAIRHACETRDVEKLVSFATSEGGLIDDELRQMACEYFTRLLSYWIAIY